MSSLHYQLLSSNEVPSDNDIRDITTLISDTQKQISSYIATSPATLTHELNSILQSIQRYTKYLPILSPVRRIPSEVLIQIFHHLLSDNDGMQYAPIAQVCRHWRMAMRPLLPSAGTFLSPRGTIHSSSRTQEVLREFNFFLDAMSLPGTSQFFSIVITDPLRRGDIKNPLIDAIFTQVCRICSLEITLEPSAFVPISERLANQLDALRALKLTISGTGTPGIYAGSLYLFADARRLRHLELITPMKVLVKFSISQLISYKERSLSDINVHHIRQNGPKLERLEHTLHTPISNPYCLDHSEWSEAAQPLTSLDLRTYNVDINYSRSVDQEWSENNLHNIPSDYLSIPRTTLPQLQEVRIRDPDRSPVSSLIHLIQRSSSGPSSTLTKLALCGLRCEPGQLYKLLALTPRLTHLECNDISPVDTLLLSALKKSLPIPLLHTLVVHNAGNTRAIEEFVIKRNAPLSACQRLHTVRLLYERPSETLEKIRELGFGSHSARPDLDKNLLHLKELSDGFRQGIKKRSTWKDTQSFLQRIMPSSRQQYIDEVVAALTELEAVGVTDPFIIKLSHIHTLHAFSSLLPLERVAVLLDDTVLERTRALLGRWMAAFQLQQLLPSLAHPNPSIPKWIMISPHCISLDSLYPYNFPFLVDDDTRGLKDIPPTEYDILYGHYRCPMPEEVFWVRKDCSGDLVNL